jgi:hypothetical protein
MYIISFETEIRLAGLLAFIFILYSLWMGQLKVQGLPGVTRIQCRHSNL